MDTEKSFLVLTNTFIETAHRLGASEKKILNVIAHKIRTDPISDNHDYYFTQNDLTNVFDTENIYRLMCDTCQSLHKVYFGIKDEVNQKFKFYNIITESDYNEGTMHIKISDKFKYIFTNIDKGYTRLLIASLKPLKSSYSIRLYEFLKKYEKVGSVTIPLPELKQILLCENSFTQYNHFRSRVLDKSKSELSSKCDISFDYKKIKISRTVNIVFDIFANTQINTEDIPSLPGLEFDPADISELEVDLHEYGYRGNFSDMIKKYGYDKVRWYWDHELKKELNTLKGKNHGGLIVERIKNNANKSFYLNLLSNNKEQYKIKLVEEQTELFMQEHSHTDFVIMLVNFMNSLSGEQKKEITESFKPEKTLDSYSIDIRHNFFKWHGGSGTEQQLRYETKKWLLETSADEIVKLAKKSRLAITYLPKVDTDDGEAIREAALNNETLMIMLAGEAGKIE